MGGAGRGAEGNEPSAQLVDESNLSSGEGGGQKATPPLPLTTGKMGT